MTIHDIPISDKTNEEILDFVMMKLKLILQNDIKTIDDDSDAIWMRNNLLSR